MEKVCIVRDFSQKRSLLQVVFDVLFVRMKNVNSRTLSKAYSCGKENVCSPSRGMKICCFGIKNFQIPSVPASVTAESHWLTLLRRRKPVTSVSWLFLMPKRSLFCALVDNVPKLEMMFHSASLLYYSTRPKPHEQFDGAKKFDKTINSYSLPKSTFLEQPKKADSQNVITPKVRESDSHVYEEEIKESTEKVISHVNESAKEAADAENVASGEVVSSKKPGIFKRFHQTYKQYGKVLIAVHVFTSSIWAGLFYVTAISGVNVEPFLRWVGASDTIMSFYTMPGVGNVAVAYLMYKLATPARYTVTIGGTHMTVKLLTQWGYMKPIPKSDNLKSLVQDSRTKVKAKYEEYQEKMEDIRDELKELTTKERKLK